MKYLATTAVILTLAGALAYDYWQQAIPIHPSSVPNRSLTITHVWATWCTPCIAEMPALVKATTTLPTSTTFVILSIDTNTAALENTYRRFGISPTTTGPVQWRHDPTQQNAQQAFGTFKIPSTMVQDDTGTVLHRHDGSLDWATFMPIVTKL